MYQYSKVDSVKLFMEGIQTLQENLNQEELVPRLNGLLSQMEAFLAQRKDYLMIVMGGVVHGVLGHCPAEKQLFYAVQLVRKVGDDASKKELMNSFGHFFECCWPNLSPE